MSSPVNQASETNRRSFEAQVEFETMMQRLRQAEHYPPAQQPTPRRRTSWADVRAGIGMVLILAAGAGVVWVFIQWQELGGPWH